jgi:hypothetical protein
MKFQIGSPVRGCFLLFSVLRESVLSYDSSPGSRSLLCSQPRLGACILDAVR